MIAIRTLLDLGAASLFEQVDKQIIVCLRDGRNFLGRLG
jgi:hypothetical protein